MAKQRRRSSGGGERTGFGPARDAAANPCQQACLVWGWAVLRSDPHPGRCHQRDLFHTNRWRVKERARGCRRSRKGSSVRAYAASCVGITPASFCHTPGWRQGRMQPRGHSIGGALPELGIRMIRADSPQAGRRATAPARMAGVAVAPDRQREEGEPSPGVSGRIQLSVRGDGRR